MEVMVFPFNLKEICLAPMSWCRNHPNQSIVNANNMSSEWESTRKLGLRDRGLIMIVVAGQSRFCLSKLQGIFYGMTSASNRQNYICDTYEQMRSPWGVVGQPMKQIVAGMPDE